MALYALSGKRAATLRCYGQFRQLLEEEFRATPEEETTDFCEQILSGTLETLALMSPVLGLTCRLLAWAF